MINANNLRDFLQRLHDALINSPDQAKLKPILEEAIHGNKSNTINPLIFEILAENARIQLTPTEILLHLQKKKSKPIAQAAERALVIEKLLDEWNKS